MAPVKPPLRLLVIADTHIGSRYALVPPSHRPQDAGPATMFMDHMWACWQHFLSVLPHCDACILNGDTMEGEHPTQRSAPDSIDTNPVHQVDMALETLEPLRKKVGKLWIVRGTGFHEGKWCEAIESLGQELKAEAWGKRRYSGEVLDGEFGGLRVNAAHAQSTGAIYPGTLANRTAWFASLAERFSKVTQSDLIIRSHTHASAKGYYQGHWILSTRCWKLCNPYAIARMEYYRAQALLDLGAHLLTITPDGAIAWKDFSYEPFKADTRKLA